MHYVVESACYLVSASLTINILWTKHLSTSKLSYACTYAGFFHSLKNPTNTFCFIPVYLFL